MSVTEQIRIMQHKGYKDVIWSLIARGDISNASKWQYEDHFQSCATERSKILFRANKLIWME